MTISTTKNTWESICDLFSSIEIKESSIEIKESANEITSSFSIHLETVVLIHHRQFFRRSWRYLFYGGGAMVTIGCGLACVGWVWWG